MKRAWVSILVMLSIAGCHAAEHAERGEAHTDTIIAVTTSPTPVANAVTDAGIAVPAYPGAQEVPSSRFATRNDSGDTFTISYQTADTPAQVVAFYKAEGAKAGTVEDGVALGEQMQSLGVTRADGSRWAIKATRGDAVTIISIYRTVPRAK